MNILAQIVGFFGMAALFLSYRQTDRKKLLAFKLCADVIWVAHYLLLGAVGGAIPNFVGIFREVVFMRRTDASENGRRWAQSPIVPICFILLNWTLAIVTWKSPLSLLPICASTFVTVSLWVKKPELTRMIGAPVSVAFIVYDIFVGSWSGIVNETIALISIVSTYITKDRKDN